MINVKEATALVKQHSIELCAKEIKIENSCGFFLAESIFAVREQPPFDRVAMDGIALCFSTLDKKLSKIKLCGVQKAGSPVLELSDKDGAIEVMTGAPLPLNCDTVIKYEDIEINDNQATLLFQETVKLQQNIHFKGSDYLKGDLLLKEGSKINSSTIAVLASQGKAMVKVKTLPKVAIISTGDELVEPGIEPEAWQIWRSNPYTLKGELTGVAGLAESDIDLFHLPDSKEELFTKLKSILADYKIVILSGGVSKGKFDFIPGVLSDLGVNKIFHKIKQRPGKPMYFGIGDQGQNIFGLPGNPVSSLICLRRYVVESIFNSLGVASSAEYVELAEDISFNKNLTLFKSVNLNHINNQNVSASPVKGNGSGDFYSLAGSSGFLELCEESDTFKAKNIFAFYRWNRS